MENKLKSAIQSIQSNVGAPERTLSGIAGSLVLFNALRKGKILQALIGGMLVFRGTSGYCPVNQALGRNTARKQQNINIKTQITVNKPISQVYQFWRQLDNLPLFMEHLESVNILDQKRSEWKARIPGVLPEGMSTLQWTSEIVEDEPNDRIGWRSLPGSAIENAGNVHFRDAGKFGTNVYAVISYQAPAGRVGEEIGRLFTPAFEKMVKDDLKNFKMHLEVPPTEKAPSWQE